MVRTTTGQQAWTTVAGEEVRHSRSGRSVGSAGVTRLSHRRAGPRFSAGAYIDEAERLLERSRSERSPAERVTWAYRAALRGAGAVIEDERTGRRRRSNGSAWSRLRSAAPDMVAWVDEFEVHARFVARVEMGLEGDLQAADADDVYAAVCAFIDAVRDRVGYLPEVA
ncbi:SAV_6107 family HEPN domain-containing protein [Corynebacterium terpenotabidum]|nr:SAV_6107 family HEPN domain-containing protein [Corynebacterium terpenotabidum]